MRNILWIVPLLAVLATAQEPDFSNVQIKVTKVAGTVYMLEGDGGNIGVSIGTDGIVLVDDQWAPLGDKIQAALKGITDKPVLFVINTHWHRDHTGGNAYFQRHAPVIAQENVRERLKSGGQSAAGTRVPPAPKEALPIITFNAAATLHLNGEDIRALHFPRAHTDGDAVVFFSQSKVVHMGDIFVTYGFPFIDLQSGGSVRGMIAAIEQVMATAPADAKIIPGHGPVSNVADMKPFLAMLRDSATRVQKGIEEGKTVDQLKNENVLAGYESWGGPEKHITTDKFIDTLYNDLKENKTGGFDKHR
jgi:glyoxylase-like metal-dependent hydrolase (beta-lactamase superfamily II)